MNKEALNIASQCRATATHDLASNIAVDGGSGLLRELLIDAAKVIEALAQPEQGPVACRFCCDERGEWVWQCNHCGCIDDSQEPTPPQRKPLTDEQIDIIALDYSLPYSTHSFVRAIEAALGIKEQNT